MRPHIVRLLDDGLDSSRHLEISQESSEAVAVAVVTAEAADAAASTAERETELESFCLFQRFCCMSRKISRGGLIIPFAHQICQMYRAIFSPTGKLYEIVE